MVSRNPLLLVANTGAAFGNVKELLAAAKANPGHIAYSTPGNGTINHLAGEGSPSPAASNSGMCLIAAGWRRRMVSWLGTSRSGRFAILRSGARRCRKGQGRSRDRHRAALLRAGRLADPRRERITRRCRALEWARLRLRARRLRSSTGWNRRSAASCATKASATCSMLPASRHRRSARPRSSSASTTKQRVTPDH